MATWTYLKNLTLVLQTGQQDCMLYANGRNSVQLVVTFEPLDENLQPVQVNDIRWGQKTKLIDYITASEIMYEAPSGWTYTSDPYQWYNAVPLNPTMSAATHEALKRTAAKPPDNDSENGHLQAASSQYHAWVYCYPDAFSSKAIGIKITTDAGKTYYSALYQQPDAEGIVFQKITITPLVAINYDRTNTNLDREDTANGSNWDQDNYYFSINQQSLNGHIIKQVDYVPTVMGPGKSYCGGRSGGHLHYHFVWPLGDLPDGTTFPDVKLTLQAINSRGPNILTLTRLSYWYPVGNPWWYDASFTIYDQFGNKGDFQPTHSDDWNTLDVKDGHWS
jgi:hypothetical protein